jgi:hypothetical protein
LDHNWGYTVLDPRLSARRDLVSKDVDMSSAAISAHLRTMASLSDHVPPPGPDDVGRNPAEFLGNYQEMAGLLTKVFRVLFFRPSL